jgi:hypothetical protein
MGVVYHHKIPKPLKEKIKTKVMKKKNDGHPYTKTK